MKKNLKILIVDDHPMIIEAYKNIILSDESGKYDYIIDGANNCDTAIDKIKIATNTIPYDILYLDVKLPPSCNGEIISGEDLAIFAKEILPRAKIVIQTTFNENHRIQNILRTVNPDGLLIKNDITSKEFMIALDTVINNPPYYSTTVARYFRKQQLNFEDNLLDDVNRKIIFHLSKGVKTKDLTNYVSLSLSAIEKRKAQIKNLLGLDSANDEELIKEAKKRGFI